MADLPFAFEAQMYGPDQGTSVITLAASGKAVLFGGVFTPTTTTGGILRILKGDGSTGYWPASAVAGGYTAGSHVGAHQPLVLRDGLAIVASANVTAGAYIVLYAPM